MRDVATWLTTTWDARAYDARARREAEAALAAIVAWRPEPSGVGSRRITEYAQEVLGSDRFAPWLRVYAAWAGEFREGWIPKSYFGRVVLPRVQSTGADRVSAARTLAARTLMTDRMPDLAYCVRGVWLDTLGRPLQRSHVQDTVFAEGDTVIVRLDRAPRGHGIYRLRAGEFGTDALAAKGNLVVQRAVSQAGVLERIAPDSAATLRIITTKEIGRPARAVAGSLRFGRAGELSARAGTDLTVPVVDGAGALAEDAILPDWTPTAIHPDTGTLFAGLEVPAYGEARALCAILHDRVPHIEIAGWDIAIDRDHRIWLLDWHPGAVDIAIPEAACGPCFDDMGWEHLWKLVDEPAAGQGVDQRLWRASA